MAGEQALRAESIACVGKYGSRGFHREAFAPERLEERITQLVDVLFGFVRTKAATPDEIAARKQEDRPKLNMLRFHCGDFTPKAVPDVVYGKRTADEARHTQISPERDGQRKILHPP